MPRANQTDQLQTALGGGFVHEEHREPTEQNLPPPQSRSIGIAAVWLVFFVFAVVNVGVAKFSNVTDSLVALNKSH